MKHQRATINVVGDISTFEIETLVNTLSETFHVDTSHIELREIERDVVTSITILLPVPYASDFQERIGFERWQRIKRLLIEIKRRRGRHRLFLSLRFQAGPPAVSFSCEMHALRLFELALNQLDYLPAVVEAQLAKAEGENVSREIEYHFHEDDRRWNLTGGI